MRVGQLNTKLRLQQFRHFFIELQSSNKLVIVKNTPYNVFYGFRGPLDRLYLDKKAHQAIFPMLFTDTDMSGIPSTF